MSYSPYAGPSSQQMFSQSGYPSQPPQPVHSQNFAQFGSPDISQQASVSVSEILLDPLARLQTLSHTVFQSLGPPQSRPPPPPSVGELLSVDAQLAAAVQVARTHQVKQRRIEQLKGEVLDLDRHWREIVRALDEGRRELDAIVREGEERIKAIDEAKAAAIPYPELLAYAQSLSAFTSAPPNMPDLAPGQPPPPLFFPPFPNEEKMRRGHMNDEAPLGILGETHSVKPPPVSPTVELPALPGANPYRPDFRPPQQQPFPDFDLDLNPDL
ncbi:vitamin-D-receptor interacting mediator subunit 4-domain-containing protein [Dichomitus squalens]|uniref:Mediator of RNA polymerase II transcription subunit 4 n=1 Tax=Dichomitus squalens TaxID=114155 RepID=A0A4Q9PTC7_9APHY|nr:vitamin-D-receptor interacting mediator subunit 4-domain-containing protein [Dichomitus squalens]TBU57737.1 vitamin-D-receptor interacting mediator subunit 4-domain-containing protein [Dichomitus squalens]